MNGEEEESVKALRDALRASRTGAILRCAEIMVDSGRKDIARQILEATHIGRAELAELKAQVPQTD